MRNIIAAVFIFISIFSFSQKSFEENNRFAREAEIGGNSLTAQAETANATAEEFDENPPNIGDPVPIDDYIPLLVITAMGLIVYHTYRKKALDQ